MRKLKNLRELRERAALSQGELAGRAGISKNAVGQLERGEFNPRPATVRRLAEALGVTPEELWAPKGMAPPSPETAKEPEEARRERTAQEKLRGLPLDEQRLIAAAMSDDYLPDLPDNPHLPDPLSMGVVQFATRRLRELGLSLDQAREALPAANPALAREIDRWNAHAQELKERSRHRREVADEDTA